MTHPTALTRRRLLQLLGAGTAGAAVTACASPGTTQDDDDDDQAEPAGDSPGPIEGDLSFAHWRAEDQEVLEEIITDFTDENAGVTVRQDISASDDYQSTALQQIRSGTIGDVFTAFRGAQFVDMATAGLYLDLAGQPAVANYNPAFLPVGQHEGIQFGLPYHLVFNMPVYNVDLFEEAGISDLPLDWDGWLAMCETLLSHGVVPMAWPGGEPNNAGHLLNSMVMNNAPADDALAQVQTGELKATDDWFVHTLEQYAELRPYVQPNATGTDVEPAQFMFAEQDAAMLITGSFHIGAVRALGGEFAVDVVSPITVAADEAKYVGIHNATFILGVNQASENQAAALAFAEYLSDPAIAGIYANETRQHLCVSGIDYTDPDLNALSPWLDKETMLAPRFQFTDLDIRNAVENAAIEVLGGKSPEQAAGEAQEIIDQRL